MGDACRLYVTYRSEYLMLRDLCVGVRDRRTGAWVPLHAAACSQMLGTLSNPEPSHARPCVQPRVGERVALYASARRIITGAIVAVEAASPRIIAEADREWQAMLSAADPRHSLISLKSG